MNLISEIKKDLIELSKQQKIREKENKRIAKQKQKIVKIKIEKLFTEAIQELTWNIKFSENQVSFHHMLNWDCVYSKGNFSSMKKLRNASPIKIKNLKGIRLPLPVKENDSIHNKKFEKLFYFLEDKLDTSCLCYEGKFITMNYDGFIFPFRYPEAVSSEEMLENLTSISNFVKKTKIKLNLESFNLDTEKLQSELEARKKFLFENSNSFLFGL